MRKINPYYERSSFLISPIASLLFLFLQCKKYLLPLVLCIIYQTRNNANGGLFTLYTIYTVIIFDPFSLPLRFLPFFSFVLKQYFSRNEWFMINWKPRVFIQVNGAEYTQIRFRDWGKI